MSILAVFFDGDGVTAMRPEAGKTFSDVDVPSGENSVYVKSARVLQNSNGKTLNVGVPQFTQSEIDTKVSTKKSAISAVDTLTDPTASTLDQDEILNPTSDESQARLSEMNSYLEPGESAAVEQDAIDAIVDERKQALAELQVSIIHDECLEVPTVPQDFKDQFTTLEIA